MQHTNTSVLSKQPYDLTIFLVGLIILYVKSWEQNSCVSVTVALILIQQKIAQGSIDKLLCILG